MVPIQRILSRMVRLRLLPILVRGDARAAGAGSRVSVVFDPELRRAAFSPTTSFSVAATIQGAVAAIYGIFDDGYAETNDIEGTNPTFTCMSVDLPVGLAVTHTVTRTATGKTYAITGIKPDGLGVTTLDLEYTSG